MPGVWRPDNRMSCDRARSVSRQLSHRPRLPARGVGHVFANEASPLQVRRLRHTLQDYLSQRGAMPEVREGVGERAEPEESAAEISAVDGGTAGRLTVNAAVRFAVESSGIEEAAMTVGTRSVLYGAHCAVLHPWFLAVAWSKLYGFPWDVRLWASFWLHDIGYISKPNMDGSEGETHVELGARIMGLLFGESWAAFTAAHSRYWAKRNDRQFSRLCVADKLAFVLTPAWLYLPMTRATGELSEYMLRAKERQAGSEHFTDYESARLNSSDAREWLEGLKSYTQRWVDEHRNGGADNWTVGACAESTAAFR